MKERLSKEQDQTPRKSRLSRIFGRLAMGRGGPKKYKYTWRDTIPPLAAEAFGDERPDYFFGPVSKIPTDADRVRVVREIEELVTESKKLKAAGKYPRPEVPRSLPPGVGTGGVRH